MRISSFIQFKTLTNTLRYAIVHGHRTFTEIRSYLVLISLFFDVSGTSFNLMRKMEKGFEPNPTECQNLSPQNAKMSKCRLIRHAIAHSFPPGVHFIKLKRHF